MVTSPYKWKSNVMNNLLKTNNLFRSSYFSNFFRLSGRLSLARWLSRNVSRVLKRVSFFKSSSLICSKSFFSIFVTSSSWRVNTTTIDFLSIASSGSGPKKMETVSLLISISLSVKYYIGEKWDWDQKWDRLAFMAPDSDISLQILVCIVHKINTWELILVAILDSISLFYLAHMSESSSEPFQSSVVRLSVCKLSTFSSSNSRTKWSISTKFGTKHS